MTTDLAVREYTDSAIKTRMRLNQQAGYGLERANAAQLNIIFLLCQRYQLDPVSDITLYEGRPFITIDGRLRLLRRHPEYRGYSCTPLTRDQKEAWGFDPSDIVVECTIRTGAWGEISARGRVAASEVEGARERARQSGKRPAPIGTHPVEIAEKRAIARAERAAFGQEAVLDDEEIEDVAQVVIQERNDPERVAAGAAAYDRIIGSNYDDDVPDERPQVQPMPSQSDVEMVKSVRHAAYQELSELIEALASGGVDTGPFTVKLPVPLSELREKIGQAQQAIEQALEQPQAQVAETF